jgi:CheY-like chemotaxis protein
VPLEPSPSPATRPSRPGRRLVVADNDSAVLDLLLLDLRLEGHEVVATASNGEETLEVCARYQPEVLVVDLRLGPGIDGIEVARRVTAGGSRRGAPRVVLYTNYVTPAIVAAAESAGATVVEKGSLGALRRAIAG